MAAVSLKHRRISVFLSPIWNATLIWKVGGHMHKRCWMALCGQLHQVAIAGHTAVPSCGVHSLQSQTFPQTPFILENCLCCVCESPSETFSRSIAVPHPKYVEKQKREHVLGTRKPKKTAALFHKIFEALYSSDISFLVKPESGPSCKGPS